MGNDPEEIGPGFASSLCDRRRRRPPPSRAHFASRHSGSKKRSGSRTYNACEDDAPRRGSDPARPGPIHRAGSRSSARPSSGRRAGDNPGGQGWVRDRDRARVSHLPRRRRGDLRPGALFPPRGTHLRPLLRVGHRRDRPRPLRGRRHRARVRPEQDSVRRDGRVRLRRQGHGAQPRERQRRHRVLRQRHQHQRGRHRQAHRCVSTPDRRGPPEEKQPSRLRLRTCPCWVLGPPRSPPASAREGKKIFLHPPARDRRPSSSTLPLAERH